MKDNVINSVAATISKTANTECTQIFENRLKVDIGKLASSHKKDINAPAAITKANMQSTKEIILITIIEAADINNRMVAKDKIKLKEQREKLKTDLRLQFDQHVQDLQEETNEHIANINEVSESIQKPLSESRPNQFSPSAPSFVLHEKVTCRDTITGNECDAWIVEIHGDVTEAPFYTIRFATGNQRKVGVDNLIKISHTKPQSAPSTSPSHKIGNAHATPPHVIPPQISSIPPPDVAYALTSRPHDFYSAYQGPDRQDVKSFLNHFKARLSSHEDVLTFYNQLSSQGKHYNICLIDIKDVVPDIDLCPMDISALARTKMTTALFQKLQDDNTRDATYHTLENCLQQYSTTSDGYKVLYELLRRVHPKLHDGHPVHTIPKLSECDYNLYTLSRNMRNYFEQEDIKGRHYSEKEKAKMFLANIDDERLHEARNSCLIDLNIATMQNPDVIPKHSLTFDVG